MEKKVIQILLIGCLLLVTALGGCQGKTAKYTTATPEGTVRLMLDTHCQLDAGKVAKCYAKEDREIVQARFERVFDQYYSVSIDNLQTKVLFQTEKKAEVEVQYIPTHINYYIEKDGVVKIWEEGDDKSKRFPGPPSGGKTVFIFSLVKQGGEWLIKIPD